MTVRREVSGTQTIVYTQAWTVDNRLASVAKADLTGTIQAVTTYWYDADGVRVKKSDPDGTTLYLGGVEITLGAEDGAAADFYDDVNASAFTFRAYAGTVITPGTAISYNWGTAAPITGMHPVTWGVRFGGVFSVEVSGLYTFYVVADDGTALWVAGTTLITSWMTTSGAQERVAAPTYLYAGRQYPFVLSYFDDAGPAEIRLEWEHRDCWQGSCIDSNIWEMVPSSAMRPLTRKSYYGFGGAMVALRAGPVLQPSPAPLSYIFGDHLGSSSLTTNASGQKVSEQRYKPYGEVRWSSGAGMPTDKQFTGQTRLAEGYVGTLYDYVSRAYDPVLGRFISADTIVPGAGNPQAFNRYAYVLNSPLNFTDPTGHYRYRLWFRSFAPFETFGFAYKGDDRGYSNDPKVSSRTEQNLDVDTEASTLAGTVINHASHDVFGNEGRRDGRGGVSFSSFQHDGSTTYVGFDASYHGANGLTPEGSPEIDAYAHVDLNEYRGSGYVYVSGKVQGDNFPSSEAFIADAMGNTVFLGIGHYNSQWGDKNTGPLAALTGDNQRPMFSFAFYIMIDSTGNFTSIWDGSRYLSIADWNARFSRCNPDDKSKC